MTHDRSFLPSFSKLWAPLILSVVVLFFSCRPTHEDRVENSENKPVIFVSVPPHAFLMKAIAGSEFDVRTLIEPGQDPHHWLPTPKQTLALSKAAGWFPSGLPFEKSILPKIRSQKTTLQIFPPTGTHSSTHDHETDPHTWLSPPLLIEQTELIASALSQLDPDKALLYHDRAKTLKKKIDAMHNELIEQLSPYHGRSFVIFHNALGHFTRTYDLSQNVIQSGDASPNPKRLREIIKQAHQDKTMVVFVQPQFDDQSARMVADAIGGRVVTLDPLSEDVLANLKHIADTLTAAFSQTRL